MPVDTRPYDALLLVSFGGPEKAADVMPFLANVTAGKGIPPDRLAAVGEHYFAFGGRSPINDQCRALLAAVRADLAGRDIALPVYWGNRNWDPLLTDTIARMEADGIRQAACFVTSAYSSYSGCRQYRENLFAAAEGTGVVLDRLRHYFNHRGFIEPFVDAAARALADLPVDARLVFVTHSIPSSMNAASGGPDAFAYERQHRSVAEVVATQVGEKLGRDIAWDLTYCSRSGSPATPWLEPDINDHLETLHAGGVGAVAVAPIGFISDHMEVVYDLDTEAAETAARLGMAFVRIATPGTDPRFVAMVGDLLTERVAAERGNHPDRVASGSLGTQPDRCAVDCCLNPRADLPTVGSAQ